MTTQKRNDDMVNLLKPDFFHRNEPNASWVHYSSAVMQLCGLRGYWPMSAQTKVAGVYYAKDVACGYDLTYTAAVSLPQAGYYLGTQTVLAPLIQFIAANSQYLTYGADDTQHDIAGTETSVRSAERGLTLGGWFKFDTAPASIFGLMSKWEQTIGNQRAYRLYKNAANNIVFEVSTDGAAVVSVTSTGTVTTSTWYFLAGRFDPSTTLDVWIDNAQDTNAVGVPASVFNSTEPFEIARTDRGNYLDGKASNCWLSTAQLSDALIEALWQQSRVMYNRTG